MWKNKAIRYTWLTLAFYVILVALVNWFEHLSPSGPCVPGGGMMLILISPILIVPQLINSLVRLLKGRRRHLGPVLIHAAVLTSFFISGI